VIRPLRIVQRNALVYRRVWRGSMFSSFLQPTLFLTAMGVTLGSLIDREGATLPGGVEFLQFLAPGLLASACMQTATFESSWPITGRMMWDRNYEAISATPMRVIDLVLGELIWIAIRLSMVAGAFMLVIAAFDVPRSPWAPLAIPAAVLGGLAFAGPIVAYAATLKEGSNFNLLFRFVITPLFLFSGVFFPISQLPEWLQAVAWCTPLFHSVALTRALTLNMLESPDWLVHVGYLSAMIAAGVVIAARTFDRRLRP
jgi:lipooligosaccharide transport system permease protein